MTAAQTISDFAYKSKPDARNLDHIPGEYGLPVIGKTIQVLDNLEELVQHHYVRYGEVSRINLGGQRGLLVGGADNLKDIFLDRERNFSAEMGYAETLGQFYKGGLLLRDFDEHRVQRRIFQSAFKTPAMRGYVETMNPLFERLVGEWNFHDDFHFFPAIKKTLLQVVAKVFIDLDHISQEAEVLNDAFLEVNEGLTAMIRKDIPLPWLKFHRGKNGQRIINQFVTDLIPKKRAGDGEDILSFMCKETTDAGSLYSDLDIIQHASFLLFGAHDTTTSALSHLIYQLAVHPEWQDRLREECQALGKPYLEYEDLDNMPNMELVFKETLRMHPSVQLMTRRTVRDCEIGGFRVPANTVLFIPPIMNHKMTQFWTNPQKFDPERFLPERSEQKSHSYAYVAFGGGPHKCIGMHFANMNAKVFLHQFLLKYRFRTPENYFPKLVHVPLAKPADDLPLIVEKI